MKGSRALATASAPGESTPWAKAGSAARNARAIPSSTQCGRLARRCRACRAGLEMEVGRLSNRHDIEPDLEQAGVVQRIAPVEDERGFLHAGVDAFVIQRAEF